MFVQSITFCPLNIIHWTKSGQMLDCQVQSLSIQLINGQELYKLCISLDGEWTEPVLIILLDRHLTGLGQRLDSDWIWCPISVQPSKVQEYRFSTSYTTNGAASDGLDIYWMRCPEIGSVWFRERGKETKEIVTAMENWLSSQKGTKITF